MIILKRQVCTLSCGRTSCRSYDISIRSPEQLYVSISVRVYYIITAIFRSYTLSNTRCMYYPHVSPLTIIVGSFFFHVIRFRTELHNIVSLKNRTPLLIDRYSRSINNDNATHRDSIVSACVFWKTYVTRTRAFVITARVERVL